MEKPLSPEGSRNASPLFLESELDTLYSVSQVLSRSLDLKETFREVLQVIADGCGLHMGLVALLADESGNELVVSAAHGHDADAARDIRYTRGEGVIGLVMERGRSVILDEVARERRFLDRLGVYDPHRPFIAVPIRLGADLPLLLIFSGVIGGLLAFGLVGIFVGPVVLAVGWTLLGAWLDDGAITAIGWYERVRRADLPAFISVRGPSASAGKNCRPPMIRMIPTSRPTKSGVVVGKVPAVATLRGLAAS